MNYWSEFLTIATIDLLAIISPGPAFALVVRNSFKYSKRTAMYTATGLALGVGLHIVNSLIGTGYIVAQSYALYNLLKITGALYLIYVGYRSLTHIPKTESIIPDLQKQDITPAAAIKMGFITNATNPKALIFFMSLFASFISASTPLAMKALYGIEMVIAEFLWFALVGILISHTLIQSKIGKFQHGIERVMGIVLTILGVKILVF